MNSEETSDSKSQCSSLNESKFRKRKSESDMGRRKEKKRILQVRKVSDHRFKQEWQTQFKWERESELGN